MHWTNNQSSLVHSNDLCLTKIFGSQNPCCICKGLQVKFPHIFWAPTPICSLQNLHIIILRVRLMTSTHSSLIHLYICTEDWHKAFGTRQTWGGVHTPWKAEPILGTFNLRACLPVGRNGESPIKSWRTN